METENIKNVDTVSTLNTKVDPKKKTDRHPKPQIAGSACRTIALLVDLGTAESATPTSSQSSGSTSLALRVLDICVGQRSRV